MSSSICKLSVRAFFSTSGLSLIMSAAASAQSQTDSYSIDGLEFNYSHSDTSTQEIAKDLTGQSPDRAIHQSFENAGQTIILDGPRDDVEDIYRVEWTDDRRIKTVFDPLGNVTRFEFNESFRLISKMDANGSETDFSYDDLGRLVTITRGFRTDSPQSTELTYSEDGLVTALRYPSGRVLDNLQDENGRYTRQTERVLQSILSDLTDNTLEDLSKNTRYRDKQALARRLAGEYAGSDFTYDDQGRLESAQNPEGSVVSFTYDDYNNLSEVTDPRGVVTRYTYDGFGQLTEEISAERGMTRYDYDAAGNVIKETRGGGLIIKRDYDALNRMTREVFKVKGVDRKVNRYSYDNCQNGVGRVCRVTSDGHITRYAYNEFGQYTKVETKDAGQDGFETVRYRYGANGRLDTLNYSTDLKVRYRYRDDGTVSRIVGWYGPEDNENKFIIARNINIDPVTGQVEQLTYGNGIKSNYAYNENGLTDVIALRRGGQLIDQRRYSYDDASNVTAITRPNSQTSQQFGYTALGRIAREQRGNDEASYSYDAAGNRTARDNGNKVTNYSYEAGSNQLAAINNKPSTFDERGNLTADRRGKRSLTYDVTNRMTEFYKDGELKASYRYNAFGQRISKTTQRPMTAADDHKSLRFAYTPGGQLLSEIGHKDDSGKAFTHEYVWLGAMPIAKLSRKVKADGSTRRAELTYIHTDHLNTPRSASNEAGETVWLWEGDAFGASGFDKDPDGDGKPTNIRLRFAGQYHDAESGLYYNHHRDYDPSLGRYVQSDPIGLGDGTNRYNYVKANPVNYIDPDGLSRIAIPRVCTLEEDSIGAGCGSLIGGGGIAVPASGNGGSRSNTQRGGGGGGTRDRGLATTLCAGVCTPPEEPVQLGENGLPCSSDLLDVYSQLNYTIPDNRFTGTNSIASIIGGNVGRDIRGGFIDGELRSGVNTCAIRLSCALNAAGIIVPFIPQTSTLITGGANEGTRVLYDTRALHNFLTSITPHTASNLTASQVRSRLAAGQVAITIRPAEYTQNSNGTETLTQFGHAGIVADNGYEDPNIPRSGNDIWFLETCGG